MLQKNPSMAPATRRCHAQEKDAGRDKRSSVVAVSVFERVAARKVQYVYHFENTLFRAAKV